MNSAFFGFARECSRASEAVQLLGVIRVRSLVLGMQIFSSFRADAMREFNLEQVWHHSLRTAIFARRIAEIEGAQAEMLEQAFSAGILHDVGRLALAAYLPGPFGEARDLARAERLPMFQAERRVLGANHADLGGSILNMWGLPTPLAEAVMFHHEPLLSDDGAFCPTTAVHAAAVLAQEHTDASVPNNSIDPAYLDRLGLNGRAEAWRTAVERPES